MFLNFKIIFDIAKIISRYFNIATDLPNDLPPTVAAATDAVIKVPKMPNYI